MKKIIISLFTFIILFSGSVFAGQTYSNFTDYYGHGSDLDYTSSAHIMGLAKDYILSHPEYYITCFNGNTNFINNDSIFNYCYIYQYNSLSNFTVFFTDTPATSYNNYDIFLINSKCVFVNIFNNNKIYFADGSTIIYNNNTGFPMNYSDTNTLQKTPSQISHMGDWSYVYNNVDMLVNNQIYQAKNSSYSNVVYAEPSADYDIHMSDINSFVIRATPYNIGTPYDLHAYIEYFSSYNNNNMIRDMWLEDDMTSLITTGFHVDLDVKKIELVYSWGNNDSYTKTINFSSSTVDSNPLPVAPDHKASLTAYSESVLDPLTNTYIVYTTIFTYYMNNGYHLYYDYDGTCNFHDLNYQYKTNTYTLETREIDKNRFENYGLDIFFYITDENDDVFYVNKYNTVGDKSSSVSSDEVLTDTDFNYLNSNGSSYYGSFGNLNINDLNNISSFNVNDGISAMNDFFTSVRDVFAMISQFLSCFPNWLTIPIYTFLTILFIITIIKFIRG